MDFPTGGIFGLLRILFKPIIDYFERLLFYRAYLISTLHHSYREAFDTCPEKLTDGIEYRIFWEPYYLRKRLVTPMIWLRSTNGAKFHKIVLTATASNRKIKYQDTITVHGLDDTPIQLALTSIPFRELKFDGNIVYTPYDRITTEILELHGPDECRINIMYPIKKCLQPFDNLEVDMGLRKGYVEKWGEIFNLELIEVEVTEERIRLMGSTFGKLRPIDRLKAKLFSPNWVVKSISWSKNVIFAKQLTSEFVKYRKELEESNKWQQKTRNSDAA
ncbi:hypothetical protein [Allohahella sp. A8]|uniref:hypothetical protein n=1 Tax=Allohahella sp. A8 TaxID=3141461 RepID=UPI003A809F54